MSEIFFSLLSKQKSMLERRNISCVLLFLILSLTLKMLFAKAESLVGFVLFMRLVDVGLLCLLTDLSRETSTFVFILQSGCIGILAGNRINL